MNDGSDTGRLALPGEVVDLPAEAAAPFVPWRLKPRPDLEVPVPACPGHAAQEGEAQAGDEPAGRQAGMPGVDATEGAAALAEERGIDLATVRGSGKGGRILKLDVEALLDGDAERQPGGAVS